MCESNQNVSAEGPSLICDQKHGWWRFVVVDLNLEKCYSEK